MSALYNNIALLLYISNHKSPPMVFIQSQGYTDSYGKKSKNIVDLAGQTDFKMSLNPDTGLYDVAIVMGDYEKYLFSEVNEDNCTQVFQNMLKYHGANEAANLVDVNAFMIPEVEKESSLEEIEDLMTDVLEFFGYTGLVQAWCDKVTQIVDEDEQACREDMELNTTQSTTTNEVVVSSPCDMPPFTNLSMPIMEHRPHHDKYAHYV